MSRPRARAVAAAEPFQILVNNAGTNRPAYLPDVKVEDFDAIFALNVRAAFFMAQAVALRLIEAKLPGSIINISSQMGHVGAARRTVYCASKHAMEGFTKAMAIELAPHNIRVNSLGPTFLETPMTGRSSRTRRSATRCCRRSSSAASASSTSSPAPSCSSPPTRRR